MTITYLDKYIKYKKKYLDLKKNISAGSSLQNEVVPGNPLDKTYWYKLNINQGTKKIESHTVKVDWKDMAEYLKTKYLELYDTSDKANQHYNVLDMTDDEFNEMFGEDSVIKLYTNPPISVTVSKNDHDFKTFVKEVLCNRKVLTNVNMDTLEKFTLSDFKVTKHAEERDEVRGNIQNALISDLKNPNISNLGTTALYTDPKGGTKSEQYFVVTKVAMGVFSPKKDKLITTWKLDPSYNSWLDEQKRQKPQKPQKR
jgi:hypothetical protein